MNSTVACVLYARNHYPGAIEVSCGNYTHSTFSDQDRGLEQQHVGTLLGP